MPRRRTKALLTATCAVAGLVAAPSAGAAPAASSPPTISGRAVYGATLSCTNGTWSAGAGSFSYVWELADGGVPIGTGQTLRVRAAWVTYGIVCAVSGRDSTGTATATSAPVTAQPAPVRIRITRARQVSRASHKVLIAGSIAPVASLQGGAASLVLYRETSSGLQQLSFTGPQTVPDGRGRFSMTADGEPVGRNTYVLEYVPSALGYASQTLVTIRIRVVR